MNPVHERLQQLTRRHLFGRAAAGLGAAALGSLLGGEATDARAGGVQRVDAPASAVRLSGDVDRVGTPSRPRGHLGVELLDVDQRAARLYGFSGGSFLGKVEPNTPAAKSGLEEGDVILAEVEFGAAIDLENAKRFAVALQDDIHSAGDAIPREQLWCSKTLFVLEMIGNHGLAGLEGKSCR